MSLPWPVRSVVAGAAGTTTLTLAYAAERKLRKTRRGPLDYDDSLVPGQIVASVMHLPHVTDREDHELGLALRWGYGSAFGLMHGLLRRSLREPRASAAFGGMLMSATLTLFPLLGRTPPPWRWPPDVLATSLGTHADQPNQPRRKLMRGVGRAIFAATLLLIAGTVNIVYGIGALDNANIFRNGQRFVFTNLNTMGWVLIILGIIQLAGGFSLINGSTFGRVIAIVGAGLGAIAALFSISGPNPWWSLAVFFLCIYVIHGIFIYGDDAADLSP